MAKFFLKYTSLFVKSKLPVFGIPKEPTEFVFIPVDTFGGPLVDLPFSARVVSKINRVVDAAIHTSPNLMKSTASQRGVTQFGHIDHTPG